MRGAVGAHDNWWEHPEELSWEDGSDAINEFFPDPNLLRRRLILPEHANIDEIEHRGSRISPHKASQEINHHKLEGCQDQRIGAKTTYAPATPFSTNQTPAPLALVEHQSLPQTWPLQQPLTSSESSPVIRIVAYESPALPSSSVLAPSSAVRNKAQAQARGGVSAGPSSPSPYRPMEAPKSTNVFENQESLVAPRKKAVQTMNAKNSVASHSFDEGQNIGIAPSNEVFLAPPLTMPPDPAIPAKQSNGNDSCVEASTTEKRQITQTESEVKFLGQLPGSQHTPAKKARAARQRRKSEKAVVAGPEEFEKIANPKIAVDDRGHPKRKTATARRERKPAQAKAKKSVAAISNGTDGAEKAELTAEMEGPETARLATEGAASTEAESMDPAAKKHEINKADAAEKAATGPQRRAQRGRKRKETGAEVELGGSGQSAKGDTVANGDASDEQTRGAKVEKKAQRKSVRLSKISNDGKGET
ncbi:MAG: hypothetical protein M1821_002037 [Bathelium mastoideum]|nr:MAG: hypothetical protein M1821_002037 [Bathelium mastoideum]